MADDRHLIRRETLPLAAGVLALGACGIVSDTKGFVASDFCADLMKRSYPDATFEIASTKSANTGLASETVTITAKRTDLPPTPGFAVDVAVECKFDHNVLTVFRWTAGPFK